MSCILRVTGNDLDVDGLLTVIPLTPSWVSASRTSSSLNGLMTATIIFIACPRAVPLAASFGGRNGALRRCVVAQHTASGMKV